ncbi:MAG: hypothetical protein HKN13_01285 [Rhodothermales bacterium]|nr:hypothetical protein [Rhodothermales bacterium]
MTKFFLEDKEGLLKYIINEEKRTPYQALREVLEEQIQLHKGMVEDGMLASDEDHDVEYHAAIAAIEHIENGPSAADAYLKSVKNQSELF